MNWIDVLVVSLLLLFGGKGFIKGFVNEVFTLGALIIATIASIAFYFPVSQFINSILDKASSWTSVITFSIIFVLTNFIIRIIGERLEKALNALRLNLANRILGVGIGCLKVLIVAYLLLNLLISYPISQELVLQINQSSIYKALMRIENPFRSVPQNIKTQIDELLESNKNLFQK